MKTRRILAASTAALLSFASVAVVANAAVSYDVTNVTIAEKDDAAEISVTAETTKNSIETWAGSNLVVKGKAAADDATNGISKGDEVDLESSTDYTLEVSGDEKSNWTVTVKAKEGGKAFKDGQTFKLSIAFGGEKANISANAGSDMNLNDGITASVAKENKKVFDGYEISASPLDDPEADGSDEDAVINVDESEVIKGLSADLKKEFGAMKPDSVKIINVELANGKYVENKAPKGTSITLKVTVPFKAAGVYHVSGDAVDAAKLVSVKPLKDTEGEYEVVFEASNFSPFIITSTKLKNVSAAPADDDPATDDGSSAADGTTSPDTGIALAIAPVVLAAGAVAVVALKKKH